MEFVNYVKERRRIIITAIELIVIVCSIIVATYAWFYRNKEVDTADIAVTTNSHVELLVSLDDGKTWTSDTSFNIPANFIFSSEITSDGVNFYKATSKDEYGVPLTLVRAISGEDYLEFRILFKSSGDVGVFLQNTSYVIPGVGTDSSDLVGSSAKNKSSSGNFSRDLIAGAVRVAFVDTEIVDDEYVPNSYANLVWAPNKNYYVYCDLYACDVDLFSDRSQEYRYIDGSSTENSYKYIANFKDKLSANFSESMAYGDPYITLIRTSEDAEGNSSGIHAVTVRIWIEGNDREAINALAGGEFNLSFDFIGFQKQIVTNKPEVSKLGSGFKGFVSNMEYSVDRGVNWIKYSDDPVPSFDASTVVYVRYSETGTAFASDYVILEY